MIKELDFFEEIDSDFRDELTLLKSKWIFLIKAIDYIDKTESYCVIDRNTNEHEFVLTLNEALVKLWEKTEFYLSNSEEDENVKN